MAKAATSNKVDMEEAMAVEVATTVAAAGTMVAATAITDPLHHKMCLTLGEQNGTPETAATSSSIQRTASELLNFLVEAEDTMQGQDQRMMEAMGTFPFQPNHVKETNISPSGGPHGGPSGPGGYERPGPQYQQHQGGSGYPMGPQGGSTQHEEDHKKKSGHGWLGMAAAAAAGIAGGALLMHEGEKVKDDWEEDKYSAENKFNEFGRDVENAPENVAGWTGEKVGEMEEFPDRVERRWDNAVDDVEDVPERVERKWDNAVDDVEDAPERVAGWMGDKVGEVEGYGDRIDDAYDQGRADGRYDEEYGDGGRDDDRW